MCREFISDTVRAPEPLLPDRVRLYLRRVQDDVHEERAPPEARPLHNEVRRMNRHNAHQVEQLHFIALAASPRSTYWPAVGTSSPGTWSWAGRRGTARRGTWRSWPATWPPSSCPGSPWRGNREDRLESATWYSTRGWGGITKGSQAKVGTTYLHIQ